VTGIAQANDANAMFLCFVDAVLHSLFANGLAESIMTIQHSNGAIVRDNRNVLASDQRPVQQPVYISGHADDAVAVMPCQIGANEATTNPFAFFRADAVLFKDFGNKQTE